MDSGIGILPMLGEPRLDEATLPMVIAAATVWGIDL